MADLKTNPQRATREDAVRLVEKQGAVALDLFPCPRCHSRHMLTFQPFREPANMGGHTFTHFAYCRNSAGEPVLLRVQRAYFDHLADEETVGLAWT